MGERALKTLKFGKHAVPAWLVALILVSVIGVAALAYDFATSFTMTLNVKEPISTVDHPSQFSLFPGEESNFNVTVMNYASVNYSVILNFKLNDSEYQASYVSFSDQVYNVTPGQHSLEAWISVATDAPAANVTVSVDLLRLGKTNAGWWNTDWRYRKSHVITSAAGAGTGYQVEITVIKGSGIDSLNTVYVGDKANADFGDVRFVANDNTTSLNYWIESLVDGQSATFWVKVTDDLSVSDATIWMYYGNPAATSQSNVTATFLFGDDWENGSDNVGTLWNCTGIRNTQGGTDNVIADGGSRVLNVTLTESSTSRDFQSIPVIQDNIAIRVRAKMLQGGGSHSNVHSFVLYSTCTNSSYFEMAPYYYNYYTKWVVTYNSAGAFTNDGYYFESWDNNNYKIIETQKTGSVVNVLENNAQIISYSSGLGGASHVGFGVAGFVPTMVQTYFDWFTVRKYVNPEPRQGVWGTEQAL